ncbi:MAG: hypothetical protein H7A55_10255 [Verrucomicrobiaceae bacterium]|nr:hypothetical protein [Verrucomicrobiaceae bacterium]
MHNAIPWRVIIGGFWLIFSSTSHLSAQKTAEAPPPPTNDTVSTLRSVYSGYEALRAQIEEQRKKQKSESTEAARTAAQAEAERLEKRRQELERDLNTVATGVDLRSFDSPAPSEDLSIQDEFARLVKPILNELQDLSRKPRQLQSLKADLELQKARSSIAGRAISAIDAQLTTLRIAKKNEDSGLLRSLTDLRKTWVTRQQDALTRTQALEHQITEIGKEEDTGFWSILAGQAKNFVFTRGKNILLALLAFIVVLLGLRALYFYGIKYFPAARGERTSFARRFLGLVSQGMSAVLAVLAALSVLYASGDWLLGGLAVLALIGLVLLAKNGVLHYFEQVRMLLNLGSVREGERVVIDGVPWQVGTINLFTQLTNPLIPGRGLRLPLDTLMATTSRPCVKGEPWLPAAAGEWVLIDEQRLAQVKHVAPDFVELAFPGGAERLVPLGEFVQMQPTNLSHGFGLSTTFGLDYKHQAEITSTIPKLLTEDAHSALNQQMKKEDILECRAEFLQAAASSLDLILVARFSGAVADRYIVLSRTLQKIAVDSCNRRGWVIPFQQIVVHQA